MLKPTLLTLALTQAAACVIVDDGYYYEPAQITAEWSFVNVATDTDTGCPVGFDTVALVNLPVDAIGPLGPPFVDFFDCNAGRGTAVLDPFTYETWIEVVDRSDTQLYAQSLSSFIDVIDFDATFTAEIVNDGGYFAAGWRLVGADTGRPLSCRDVRADTIVLTTSADERTLETQTFPCSDQFGITTALAAGDYNLSISVQAGEQVLTSAPVTFEAKKILDRNQVTDLGDVTLTIAGH